MTGIGKTTLAERLAAENLGTRTYLAVDCQRDFGEGDFIRGAIVLLGKLGDETAQQLPEDQVLPYLVQRLSQGAYWVQLDSVEALVQNDRFQDARWGTALVQILREADVRWVVTTQVIPQDWDEEGRWTAAVETLNLAGLERERVLELFERSGVRATTETEQDYLLQIAEDFQQHPFILQITAGEIKLRPFNGDVGHYWRDYYQQERQERPKLRQSQRSQVEARVRRVIEQLPEAARRSLLAGSVFNRAVQEDFYLSLLPLAPDGREGQGVRAGEALELLIARELVQEREWSESGWLLGQHNLVRQAALEIVQKDSSAWETAHRQAADLWLNHYQPAADASNLETVRGYLEAFDHFCAVEDWDAASEIAENQTVRDGLIVGGYYREAIPFFQKLLGKTKLPTEIFCNRNCGNAYYFLGDIPSAAEYWQKSLDIAQQIGDQKSQGAALGNLGNAYDSLGDYVKAIDFHQQYLTIAWEIGDKRGEGNALGNLGGAYDSLGDYAKAIDFHQQSLAIKREIGNKQGEGNSLGNLGNAYYSLGNYTKAIDFHQQRLTIAREIGDKRGEGNALGNLGNAYDSLGDYAKAIDFHQQHLTIAQEIGDKKGEGAALGNLGLAYDSLGDYAKAIDFHQQHLTIAREIGDKRGEGMALGNLGNAYHSLGDYAKAIDFHQQYLTIAREIGDKQGEGAALVNMGATQLKLEQYEECLANNQAALAIFETISVQEGIAEAHKNLAELHQALGEIDIARNYAQQALTLAQTLNIPLQSECAALLESLDKP